jgi:hypothetical protein
VFTINGVIVRLGQRQSWSLNSPSTPTHPPPPPTTQTFKALPAKVSTWFLVCNLILTQLERRPPNKMEDNLKRMEDNLKRMEDNLKQKWKWKTSSFLFEKLEWRRPKKMEYDLKKMGKKTIKKNGRQPQKKNARWPKKNNNKKFLRHFQAR